MPSLSEYLKVCSLINPHLFTNWKPISFFQAGKRFVSFFNTFYVESDVESYIIGYIYIYKVSLGECFFCSCMS